MTCCKICQRDVLCHLVTRDVVLVRQRNISRKDENKVMLCYGPSARVQFCYESPYDSVHNLHTKGVGVLLSSDTYTNYSRLSTHFRKNRFKIELQTTLCLKLYTGWYGNSYAESHVYVDGPLSKWCHLGHTSSVCGTKNT
jgi:hypothetical protein